MYSDWLLSGNADKAAAFFAAKWYYDVIQLALFLGFILLAGVVTGHYIVAYRKADN